MSIDPILSALRTLQYSSAKLADLITVGIADAEVRAQVREACLRELRWVDALVGGESADGLRLTDAEREAVAWAEAAAANAQHPAESVLRSLLERHAT